VIGATGAGKSTLFKQLMRQRLAFCLIDKEGDLAREMADAMPCI
jgi:adenylate kinase family enzyme